MITLHQLAISHYCEKARWALAHKQLEHRVHSYLPGPHAMAMQRLGLRSAMPVLQDGDRFVQGSSDIVTYLDATYPERPLTPADPELARQAREREAWADEQIGPHVRRICYHHLLAEPGIVLPLLAHGGPWYGRFALRWLFPKLRDMMRDKMQIDEEHTRASEKVVDAALDELQAALGDGEFLVGDRLSRADIAAAALLAPLHMPEKYGIPWPRSLPPRLAEVLEPYTGRLAWVDHMYAHHR